MMHAHLCQIPCNSLPLVSEADFGLTLKPIIHVDRTADFNVLIYLLKGGMEIIEDGTAYELMPGTLFFLKSGVHHWGVKPFQSGTSWYYAHFHSNVPDGDMTELNGDVLYGERSCLPVSEYKSYITLPKVLRVPAACGLEKEMEKLIHLFKSAAGADIIRPNLLMWEILLHCLELGQGNENNRCEDSLTKKVTRFLEQNSFRNFAAAELEGEVGLTYKYTGTLLKSKTGMTIKEYQLMLRMRKAVRLLCETELSIAQIASETGFYDAFYFSKIFRREKGISPRRFRQAYVPKM